MKNKINKSINTTNVILKNILTTIFYLIGILVFGNLGIYLFKALTN